MRHPLVEQDLAHIADAVGSSFRQLHGKTVLITGGTGFIGMWLLETLNWLKQHQGVQTRTFITTRSPERFMHRAAHLLDTDVMVLNGDVRSFQYPDEPCHVIIHAAGSPDPQVVARNPLDAVDTIVDGTRFVLELAARTNVERFLFISSGAVYGEQPADISRVAEDYMGAPDVTKSRSSYGEAKRYAEAVCSLYRDSLGVPVRVARPFTFAGPYQSRQGSFAISEFVRCSLAGEPIRIQGDGTALRSYCYAADLAAALWKITLDSNSGSVFNVGSESEISIADLARLVVEMSGADVPVVIASPRIAPGPTARYIPDTTQLRQRLGLHMKYDLRSAVERTLQWSRAELAAPRTFST